jgi:hypothetical protein
MAVSDKPSPLWSLSLILFIALGYGFTAWALFATRMPLQSAKEIMACSLGPVGIVFVAFCFCVYA